MQRNSRPALAGLCLILIAAIALLQVGALASASPTAESSAKKKPLTKKQVIKLIKQFAGSGPAGPQGSPGANGTNGSVGATGPAGTNAIAGPPTGAAGGDLGGAYPNPTLSAAAKAALQARVSGTCASGSAVRLIDELGAVTCEPVGVGDITGITAGTGLTGGGTVGTPSLAVDPAIVQSRVSGSCAGGQAFQSVAQAGTVSCGNFWALAGNAGTNPSVQFLGTTDAQPLILRTESLVGFELAPASTPNLIGGHVSNSYTAGVIAATIGGGGASSNAQKVTDSYGTVGGGLKNVAGNEAGTTTDRQAATVSGGESNIASGLTSAVGGGGFNTASGSLSTIGGGGDNAATSPRSSVGGGFDNTAGGENSVVGGGWKNDTMGPLATVGGGFDNSADGEESTIGGGTLNYALGRLSTVSGGSLNVAANPYAAVVGGFNNEASGSTSFVGGGGANVASGTGSAIAGGDNVSVGGSLSFSAGQENTVNGSRSVGLGSHASIPASDDGSFVFADETVTSNPFSSSAANQFSVRASGGIRLRTKSDASTGCNLAASSGSWECTSDRDLKHRFQPIDEQGLLEALVEMPISTWSYRGDPAGTRHLGPTAQDFADAFGVGADRRSIGMLDEGGAALAAAKALYRENRRQAEQIDRLEQMVSELAGEGN